MSPSHAGATNGTEDHHSSLPTRSLSSATKAVHADDHLYRTSDVAPPLHVSTTFRYASNPADLVPAADQDIETTDAHIYSRETAPTTTRLETLLHPLLHAPCVTYASGLAALHALYIFLNPRRVAISSGGYHGSHGVLRIIHKISGLETLPLDCLTEDLQAGDVVHLETPENPTGEARDIASYAAKAHGRGAYLVVDSTFAPPGLQDPFAQGADVVMHSGTKYLGGHSDLLCGVLATSNEEWIKGLRDERTYLGSVMGGMEAWLGVRSLRTLELRVQRQSASAAKLVAWLDAAIKGPEKGWGVAEEVKHASLQKADIEEGWLTKQMPGGFGPVFALLIRSEELARKLPSCLRLFQHATSLGGVESLVEWRAMSDRTVDRRLVRVSVGVEAWEDLRGDLEGGFRMVGKGAA